MRRLILGVFCICSLSLLTGCAGLEAQTLAPPAALPGTPDIVRVRILFTKAATRLDATGPFQYQLLKGGALVAGKSAVRVRAMRSSLVFDHQSFKGEVAVVPVGPATNLKVNGRRYRGTLVFHPLGNGRYDVVEYVGLEEYLYGVLPREVEVRWPSDALKAQAVVSRTYALSNKSMDSKSRFDLSDGVFDQVYGGLEVESPSSNRAVDETRGQALFDSTGKPIQAFFHSSCGGCTELPEHVWKSPNAGDAFGSVPDTYCTGDPHYHWQLTLSYAAVRDRLRRAGIRVSPIKMISVAKKSASGRAEIMELKTARGSVQIAGNRFRLALGPEALRSTLLTDMKAGKSSVWFEGRGWGHGVGLCQWGARGRAAAGQTYKDILQTYYPKAVLKTI